MPERRRRRVSWQPADRGCGRRSHSPGGELQKATPTGRSLVMSTSSASIRNSRSTASASC